MKQIAGGALHPDSVLRRAADVRFRVVDGEGVVVRQAAGEVLVLNGVATRILALADGATPLGRWIETLLGEYMVERQVVAEDVLAFAAELLEQGLLETVLERAADAAAAGGAAAKPAAAAAANPAAATAANPAAAAAANPAAAAAANPAGAAAASAGAAAANPAAADAGNTGNTANAANTATANRLHPRQEHDR
jgi:coenzyme PQQ synthesis protein D (PqqD)